jgi:hypothetical protein
VLDRFTERGVAVLLVEQFVGQALAVASRAYVLEKGEVSYAGTAAALAADEDFVKGSYLGEVEDAPVVAADGDGQVGVRAATATLVEQLTVSLPPVLVRSLQQRAEREGVPLADLVRQAVEGSLAPPPPPPEPAAPGRPLRAPRTTTEDRRGR